MQVKEILRVQGNRLLSIEPSGRAVDAVSTMAKENLGSLVVLEQGRMVGMLTFHELLQAVAKRSGAPHQGPEQVIPDLYQFILRHGIGRQALQFHKNLIHSLFRDLTGDFRRNNQVPAMHQRHQPGTDTIGESLIFSQVGHQA